MSQRILFVEDEPAMVTGLVDVLTVKGYTVRHVARGDEGLDAAIAGGYALLLLDVMLPGISGFEILKAVRARGDRTPVIMLTARGAELDRVLGFELGVDDYVTKPFSVLELLGRIQAVLRRASAPPSEPLLRLGEATVDLKRYSGERAGRPLELPAKAYEILRVLAERQGEVVSRDSLIDAVWGPDEFINQRTVNNLVVKLRQAIEADPDAPRFLQTVHGVGYRLEK